MGNDTTVLYQVTASADMKLLKALHAISSEANTSTSEKLQRLLKLGIENLGLEMGVVSDIQGEIYRVVSAITPDNSIEEGAQFSVGDTYCKDTLQANAITAYYDANTNPGSHHPCYQNFELKAYIGIPYFVNGKRTGTVNFSSPLPRDTDFTQSELDYVVLLAEWVGSELSRQEQLNDLLALQHKLEYQHRLHTHMAELAKVGTWEVDLTTDTVYLSDTLLALYEVPEGYPLTLASTMKFVLREEDSDAIHALFRQSSETGELWSYEFEAISHSGRRFWVQTQGMLDKGYQDGVRFFGATQDVTERVLASKELERRHQFAEQALQSRSLFLANMSHEIRTPINGVLGMLDVLEKTSLKPQQQEYCALARQSADSLLQIINDVLDFSKIDAGELELESMPVTISRIAEEQYRLFSLAAQKKSLILHVDTSATDGLTVMGDATRIRQIFTNLISNAIKFTDKGTVNIKTRAMPQADNHLLVQIVVQDSGVGIAPEHQSVIFSPFRQGNSETTRRFGGTGLGLSIVSQIAEHMNGGIRVNSKPGEGSTFIVALSLPQADGASENTRAEDKPNELVLPKDDLKGKRVLVVEDNEINQIVVSEHLKGFGIAPDIAQHGAEALELVIRSLTVNSPYDLILMDCQMPVMDGYEAARQIRKLGDIAQLIPVIALTANVLVGEREKCILAGMNDYLTKPLNSIQFKRCINRYLLA
ncbi:ATP-binding protein [Aestuariibacter sp. A3R04]|uniref:GAF domain-containing hybrid sensor histidine kinase/response regulator n=1 Tax=Aestuariibacter sp. A3R04 TaxID=2841571 RepID=UPI001C0959A3|nr:ATP-binding protein [Aestuariibacter sp. A3R04]MBU3023424.1 response regulator [Aestuariibacter sp. A3R04]